MIPKTNENSKGFTLIELMIVIAIIGILAAIAIPNFIAYRDKTFCASAESDVDMVMAAIADYYAVPARTSPLGAGDATLAKASGGLGLEMSNLNTATIGGTIDAITISVTDVSNRCPTDYRTSQSDVWTGFVVGKSM